MKPHHLLVFTAGLYALALTGPAAAGCGLNVNPAALDRNNNTELSRGEVYATPLAPVFDRIDTNRNGAISQTEYAGRCASLQATADNNGWSDNDSVVDKRIQQQQQRQQNRINDRVNRETNKASDGMEDRVMGAIFGN